MRRPVSSGRIFDLYRTVGKLKRPRLEHSLLRSSHSAIYTRAIRDKRMRYRRTLSVVVVFFVLSLPTEISWSGAQRTRRSVRDTGFAYIVVVRCRVFICGVLRNDYLSAVVKAAHRTDHFFTFFQACTRKHPLQFWHRGRGRDEITTTPGNRWKLRASCRVPWTRALNSQTKHATEATSDRALYKWQTIFDINSFNDRTFSLPLSFS